MKTVPGPSERVVVVGAGFAGLAAALHLAGRGREVTVVERENWPGGRAGRLDVDGYRLDTGPTVLTMPDIIDDTFAAVGETSSARMDLLDVDPAYRAQFADGSSIDVHSDADRMAIAIEEFAGATQAAGYRQLRDWLTRLYQTEFDGFIARNFDSPLSLLNPQLAKLAAIGGFRKWDAMVKRHITDPRLRRVFTFQSLYAGVAPRQALAVYAVIAYMDTVSGVLFPRGGMRALPDALAAAATDAGVQFHYGATVTGLECTGGRVAAVHTDQDQRLACDAVVLTSELPQTYTLLGREPRRLGSLQLDPVGVYPGSLGNYGGLVKNVPVMTLELKNARAVPPRELAAMWNDLQHWIDALSEGRGVTARPRKPMALNGKVPGYGPRSSSTNRPLT